MPEPIGRVETGLRRPILLILGIGCMLAGAGGRASAQAHDMRQGMVHGMGGQVMPFDLDKTLHVFEMTDSGGIEEVVIRQAADQDQVPLIRQHLQREAMRFQGGDYSDPASLHGADMPGLKDLAAGASRIRVEYSALPNGARIRFTAEDIRLITAIHRWFGAQLSDHGPDAVAR